VDLRLAGRVIVEVAELAPEEAGAGKKKAAGIN
jgi:hypothetical protein